RAEGSHRTWSAASMSSTVLGRHEILRSPLRGSLRMTFNPDVILSAAKDLTAPGAPSPTLAPSVILRPEGPKDLTAPGAPSPTFPSSVEHALRAWVALPLSPLDAMLQIRIRHPKLQPA
ncbi:MAG: hypothetical protein ACOY3Y_10430, partial [Acidobacteriota bacterium]